MTDLASAQTRGFAARRHGLFVGGTWVTPDDGRTLEVIDPSTGEVVATIALAGATDVDRAVAAARRSFNDGWGRVSPKHRGRYLARLADLIEADREVLAQLITIENGKPIAVSRSEVAAGVDLVRYMAGWCTKLTGATFPAGPDHMVFTVREAIGVVGSIAPWNYPFSMAVQKIAPPLAAGCTVVFKPSEETPLSALRLADLVTQLDLPPGTVNVIPGLGPDAGAAMAAHPDIDKIAFTGSTAVGKSIIAASVSNLKRLGLELGGKAPSIVCADADVATAAAGATRAAFANAGQICTAGARLFVADEIFDDVLAGVVDATARLWVGSGLDPRTDIGPLISDRQRRRVLSYLDLDQEAGGTVLVGGCAVEAPGYFVQPTVVVNVPRDARLMREEVFGPVVVVTPFTDLDDAIAQANDTNYGLAAWAWTTNVSTIHQLASRLRAGNIWINNPAHDITPAIPFGGMRESGWGKERGWDGLAAYTDVKTVAVAT